MSTGKIEEESKQQLINDKGGMAFEQQDEATNDFGDGFNDFDIKPNSSRVKKVLIWDKKRREFEMTDADKNDLREYHIREDEQWQQFEEKYKSLEPENHPEIKSNSICLLIFLVTIAFAFLTGLLYCFFIILQLALFNLIMLVVMLVFWYKLYKITRAIINRLLNNNRKKAFKSWIKELRDLSFLKEL